MASNWQIKILIGLMALCSTSMLLFIGNFLQLATETGIYYLLKLILKLLISFLYAQKSFIRVEESSILLSSHEK